MSSQKPIKAKPKLSWKETWQEIWVPYSQLLPYLKPYIPRFIAGLACGVLAGVLSGLFALVVKHVTDYAFSGAVMSKKEMLKAAASGQGKRIEQAIWTCAAVPGVMLLRSLFTYLSTYCISWVSLKLLVDIRSSLFAHVTSQSLDFFNKNRAGQLMQRVANDTRMAQAALTTVGPDVVVQPFTIIAAVVVLLRLDWRFSLMSLVLFPICLIPITVFGRKVRRSGRDEEAMGGAMMVILNEAFAGMKVIKALAREDYEVQHFTESGQQQFRNSIRVKKAVEIVGPIIEGVSAIGVGIALVYVYYLNIGVGVFCGLMTGLFMLYDPVKKLSKVHVQMQKCLASTTRIFEMMALTPTIQDAPEAVVLGRSRGELRFENVTFAYGKDAPAVAGINLAVEPGKSYALVGESGAGKSTILSLILRFYDPNTGGIYLDGHDLRTLTQRSLRENIAIVTQDTFLFHDTILENIRYGRLDATDAEIYEAASQAFAHDFILLQPNGYKTIIGDKGCLLSGGQQQRLAIARALLRNAPILLLDEATSALDSESERQIQSALERLSRGRTVIAIAHRLSTILKADQIVVMHQGQIRELGRHAELLEKSGLYRRLYDLQFHRHEENEELETVVA